MAWLEADSFSSTRIKIWNLSDHFPIGIDLRSITAPGSRQRLVNAMAFLAPDNNRTVHSVVNLWKDQTQSWIYMGRWFWSQPERPNRPPLVKPGPGVPGAAGR